MGQGQMEIALELLKKSSTQGTWLCLKNLHLVTPWLTTLEKVILVDICRDQTITFRNKKLNSFDFRSSTH